MSMSIHTQKHNAVLRRSWGFRPGIRGHIRIKAVNCGKENCFSCPHAFYAYHRVMKNGRVHETYLGTANADGTPRHETCSMGI